jgi:DNA-binding Lrp family transcriptional regulator
MINKKEMVILSHLRSNARKPVAEISRSTNIPLSTVFDKVKNLEDNYIIKHTSIINFNKIDYNYKVRFFLKPNNNDKDKLLSFLLSDKNVNSLFRMSNEYDFLVECIFKEMIDVVSFSEKLDEYNLLNKEMYYIVDELKHEGFLSCPDSLDSFNSN